MSKLKYIILIVGIACSLTGCQDAVQTASGSYSYKISGNVLVNNKESKLSTEQGAMEIVRVTADSALVTFNMLSGNMFTGLTGDAYATKAVITKNRIELAPYTRSLNISSKDYTVEASGEGTIYDKTILITLRYQSAEVQGDSLTMLCKKN